MEVQTDNEKNKKLRLFAILGVLVIVGAASGIYFGTRQNTGRNPLAQDELALGGMLPGKSEDEIRDLLDAKIGEGMVDIGVAVEPIFEENGKKGRLGIENIETNRYSFQVKLTLDQSGELIYESGLIKPGYFVEFVELTKKLEAGDYPATAVFSTYSLGESNDRIAETDVKLLLHVIDGTFY